MLLIYDDALGISLSVCLGQILNEIYHRKASIMYISSRSKMLRRTSQIPEFVCALQNERDGKLCKMAKLWWIILH